MNLLKAIPPIALPVVFLIAAIGFGDTADASTIANGVTPISGRADILVPPISTGSIVDTAGTFELALNLGADPSSTVINGVTFTAFAPTVDPPGPPPATPSPAGPHGVTFSGGIVTGTGATMRNLVHTPIWTAGNDFTALMQSLTDNPAAAASVPTMSFTIQGLNPNKQYNMQFFAGDTRNLFEVITYDLEDASQSSQILQGGQDGVIASFLVTGETDVELIVTSNQSGGVGPLLQGVLVTSVPEPSTVILLGAGLLGLVIFSLQRRRKRRV